MNAQLIEWMPWTVMTDGHRFFALSMRYDDGPKSWFSDSSKPMVAIADESGNEPQDTDDGILWLDFGRSLIAGGVKCTDSPMIPLLTDDGTETKTITDMPTMLMLSHKYQWNINAHGVLFAANRVL